MSEQTIDEKILAMHFDNKQFEQNVGTSLNSIDKLKKSLNFTDSAKGLSSLNDASKNFSLAGIAQGVDSIAGRFSALGVIGAGVLLNLTNSAINAGKKIANALIIEPISAGFSEYETLMNSVQTILANTMSKGTTLDDVNKALDDMNNYSDKTIYNFQEMARNIGTFTAAGVDLDTSAAAIKGIANLAAVSGSNSQQAATAMYQLSQAISSGTVRLMDWNSVVNAGMGGAVFQDALKETARVHGIAIDDIIAKRGSFRESLQDEWLSAEIMTETLKKFTGDLSAEQLKSMGYTDAQVKDIMKLGQTASDAATKVKTASQLFQTLKEAAQSGWSQTWRIIFGDFEEAKAFFTEVNDILGGMIGSSADARNELLEGWKKFGGRTMLIESLRNTFEGLMSVIKPISEAMREIFPPITAQQLQKLTFNLRELTKNFKMGEESAEKLKRTFKGVFAILDIGRMFVVAVAKGIMTLIKAVAPASGGLLNMTASLGDLIVKLRDVIKSTGFFEKGVAKIVSAILSVSGIVRTFVNNIVAAFANFKSLASSSGYLEAVKTSIVNFIAGFSGLDLGVLSGFVERVKARLAPLSQVGEALSRVFSAIAKKLEPVIKIVEKIKTLIKETLGKLLDGVINAISNIDLSNFTFEGLFDSINGGLIAALLFSVNRFINKGSGIFSSITSIFDGLSDFGKNANGILAGITTVLDGVKGTFVAWQQQIRSEILLKIAGAIAILTISLLTLSMIDSAKLTTAIGAITILFADLVGSLAIYEKANPASGLRSMVTAVGGMIAMSFSILLLSGALVAVSSIDPEDLNRGMTSIVALSVLLVTTATIMSKNAGGMIRASVGVALFGLAIRTMVAPVKALGAINTEALAKGLIGIGVLMTEISLFMNTLKVGPAMIAKMVSIYILGEAISNLGDVVAKFGQMDTGAITTGLTAVGAIMAELAIFTRITTGSAGLLASSVGILIISASLMVFASAFEKMGNMSWDVVGRGLVALGAGLAIVAIAVRAMPMTMAFVGVGLVIVASSLLILANALKSMGSMSWDEVARGLVALGGALLIVAVATNAMSGAVVGAAAMLVVAAAIAILVPPLKALASLSLQQIGIALLALAGTFLVLGVAGYLIAPVVPILLGLAVAVGILGVALLAVGVGVLAFAGGLALLAASGAAGITVFTAIVTNLATLIPTIATAIATGIINFAKTITDGAPVIFKAASTMMLGMIQAAAENVPILVETILSFIETLLKKIAEKTPTIVQAGYDILIGFLTGVKNNIGAVVTAAYDIVINFLNAISEKIPEMVQSGWNLIISLVDGMRAGVEDNLPALMTAVTKLGWAIVNGLAKGITDSRQEAIDGIMELADTIIKSFKEMLGIASPSTVFTKLGVDTVKGLINGVNSMIKEAVNTIAKLVEAILKYIQSKMVQFIYYGRLAISRLRDGMLELKNQLITAAGTLITSFINGVMSKYNDIKNAGKNLVLGLANGIKEYIYKAVEQAYSLAQQVLAVIQSVLQINSPSKATMAYGESVDLGFAYGIADNVGLVVKAAKNLGKTAVSAFQLVSDQILSVLEGNVDMNPTITPVLDLSNVQNGINSFKRLMPATVPVTTSLAYAGRAASSGYIPETTPTVVQPVQQPSVSFTQNNFSPKALDTAEIYRLTNSAIARVRKGLTN